LDLIFLNVHFELVIEIKI